MKSVNRCSSILFESFKSSLSSVGYDLKKRSWQIIVLFFDAPFSYDLNFFINSSLIKSSLLTVPLSVLRTTMNRGAVFQVSTYRFEKLTSPLHPLTLFIFYKQPPFWSTGWPISIFLWLLLSGCLISQRNSVWLLLMKNYQGIWLFTKTIAKLTHQIFEQL